MTELHNANGQPVVKDEENLVIQTAEEVGKETEETRVNAERAESPL